MCELDYNATSDADNNPDFKIFYGNIYIGEEETAKRALMCLILDTRFFRNTVYSMLHLQCMSMHKLYCS